MMQHAKVYQSQQVANMIAGKLSKSKGKPYIVDKVPTGFFVRVEDEQPGQQPLQKPASHPLPAPPTTTAPKAVYMSKTTSSVTLIADKESLNQYYFPNKNGVPIYVHKTSPHILSVSKTGNDICVALVKSYAKMRGLI